MEDLERYGDYNNDEDDYIPYKPSPLGKILKILLIFTCISVVFVLGFRMFLFNYYPDSMKNIYFNDKLMQYYKDNGNELDALTQELRAPYDDNDLGRFFADNLIVIKGCGQLQLSVRYNYSLADIIKEEYGIDIDPKKDNLFTFRLAKNPVNEGEDPVVIGELSYIESADKMMYKYHKLVFDNIDFDASGEDKIYWIRLEIFINGVEMESPYAIPIYEDNENYNFFKEYPLSKDEVPKL